MKIIFDNGEEYTKEGFQRDLIRMFDSLKGDEDKKGNFHCDVIACSDCPLNHYPCSKIDEALEKLDLIEQVYKWAKEHPIVTNRDKLIKTFGNKNFNFILSSLRNDMISEYGVWLREEYKEPDQK